MNGNREYCLKEVLVNLDTIAAEQLGYRGTEAMLRIRQFIGELVEEKALSTKADLDLAYNKGFKLGYAIGEGVEMDYPRREGS